MIRTDPGADTPWLKRGSTVTMFVSTGPAERRRPERRRPDAESGASRRCSGGLPGLRSRQQNSSNPSDNGPGRWPRTRRPASTQPKGSERHRSRSADLRRGRDRARRPGTHGHGRHDLPWRRTRDRWAVLVSEVMLHQTQVPRVAAAWTSSSAGSRRPAAMADAGPGAVIAAWGRLGYPRRARRLWEAAVAIADARLARRPRDAPRRRPLHRARRSPPRPTTPTCRAIEVNIRRVRRTGGRRARSPNATPKPRWSSVGAPLRGRDRLLALMDVGAMVCTAARPACDECPLAPPVRDPRRARAARRSSRQAPFEGSFRQRRGAVMARAARRRGRRRRDARRRRARVAGRRRPRRGHRHARAHAAALTRRRRSGSPRGEEVAQQVVADVGEDRLGVELHALDRRARGGAGPSPGRRRSRR